jgi:HEAT repeats
VRIGRSLAIAMVAALVLPCWGCGLAPHDFRKLQQPEPLVRARSVGQGGRVSDEQVVPALVARLGDEDPVVRLAANEELRKRTGRDFGYVPWASDAERADAIARWRAWLAAPPMPAGSIQPTQKPAAPAKAAPQTQSRRERRRRAQIPPPSPPTPPPTENAPS